MKKKDFDHIITYCVNKGISYSIFMTKTGDGVRSPYGYTIYLHVSPWDDFFERIPLKGIHKNTLLLKNIGGTKYDLSAEEIEKIQRRATEWLEKFRRWASLL